MYYHEFPLWLSSNDLTGIHKDSGSIPVTIQCWLRICHCNKVKCRLQMLLGSGISVAVAVASSCSSYLTPCLGISICQECSPKKAKKKKKKYKIKPVGENSCQWVQRSNRLLMSELDIKLRYVWLLYQHISQKQVKDSLLLNPKVKVLLDSFKHPGPNSNPTTDCIKWELEYSISFLMIL